MRTSVVLLGLGGLLILVGAGTWVLVLTFAHGGRNTGEAFAIAFFGVCAPVVGIIQIVLGLLSRRAEGK
ncbi:MAG TPA: hypothetical protein VMZ71_14545 [Gemmataceae bacterium]|nr:hypothetical protein [Gemmataceae bacterium]